MKFHQLEISRAQLTPSDTINQCLLYFLLKSRVKKCRFPVAVFFQFDGNDFSAVRNFRNRVNLNKEQEQ